MLFRDCVRYAGNRLRIRDLLARHPEILEVEIAAPIIVVGLPRSGTTHLVNLMAADTAPAVAAAVGELRAGPRPRRGPDPTPIGPSDPRYRRARGAVAGHGGDAPAHGGHAPHAPRPRPRGARAAAAGLLELPARMGGPGPAVGGTTTWPTTRPRTTRT